MIWWLGTWDALIIIFLFILCVQCRWFGFDGGRDEFSLWMIFGFEFFWRGVARWFCMGGAG